MPPVSRFFGGLAILLLVGPISMASGQQVLPPRVVDVPMVSYPPIARGGCLQARLTIVVSITPAGTVDSIDVLYGNKFLRAYARDFVRQWRFAPSPDSSLRREAVRLNLRIVPRATPAESLGVVFLPPADVEIRAYPPDRTCLDCSEEGARKSQLESDRRCLASGIENQ